MLDPVEKLLCFWLIIVLCVGITKVGAANGVHSSSVPCVYQGRIVTKDDWFGYLANITIRNSGAIKGEFSYPADMCCQNIIFYTERQVSVIRSGMDCWEKESLHMSAEDSQDILRLTPKFSWSGCYLHFPNTVPTYTCPTSRSFANPRKDDVTTYYMAVYNCASLVGLDLQYRIELIGHVGECKSDYQVESTAGVPEVDTPVIAKIGPNDSDKPQNSDKSVCVIEGTVKTSQRWYGFIANITFAKGGGFRFKFSFKGHPKEKQHVILYNEDDVKQITPDMKCYKKQYSIIPTRNFPDQVLDLSLKSSWNGCVSKNISSTWSNITCESTRRYDKPRKVFIAVSGCDIKRGLNLNYRFEVFGYEGDLCSAASAILPRTTLLAAVLSITVMGIMQTGVLGDPFSGSLWQDR